MNIPAHRHNGAGKNGYSWPNTKPKTVQPVHLCKPCEFGDHSQMHGRIGCTRFLGKPPHDAICACNVQGTRR